MMANQDTALIKVLEDGSPIASGKMMSPAMANTVTTMAVVSAATLRWKKQIDQRTPGIEQLLNKQLYEAGGTVYQFRHLSIQEALFVLDVTASASERGGACAADAHEQNRWCHEVWASHEVRSQFLRDPTPYANVLRIGSNRLGGAFMAVTPLERKWSFTDIGDVGAVRLAELLAPMSVQAISSNTILSQIDLSRNTIEDDGAAALARALKTCNILTVISLQGNYIGAGGATALANCLTINTTLTVINLQGNWLGADGATALARALKINATLSDINLQDNNIGSNGAAAIFKALKVNTTLAEIDLRKNSINIAEIAVLMEEALSKSRVTVHMDTTRHRKFQISPLERHKM